MREFLGNRRAVAADANKHESVEHIELNLVQPVLAAVELREVFLLRHA